VRAQLQLSHWESEVQTLPVRRCPEVTQTPAVQQAPAAHGCGELHAPEPLQVGTFWCVESTQPLGQLPNGSVPRIAGPHIPSIRPLELF